MSARRASGFTLVEMLTALGVFAIILLVLFQLLLLGLRSERAAEERVAAQRAARQALERITRDIREARQVAIGEGGRELWLDHPEDGEMRYALDRERHAITCELLQLPRRPEAITPSDVTVERLAFGEEGGLVQIDVRMATRQSKRDETRSMELRSAAVMRCGR
jgi:prepilin-type N-terminal cleavage/methylation domain-containing protein